MKKIIICALFASLGVSFAQAQQVVYVQSQPQTQKVVYVQQPQPQQVVIVKDAPPPPKPKPLIVPILNAIFDGHGKDHSTGHRHNDRRR